ncbi:MAG: DNA polymerase III subunit gamma/tau, partial [Solobacterium sp.]|nr:DNA polymerase III subunit gamma/tau [Solobacterium sp.]
MSSIALYQKYRSQSFDELVGQEYVVRAIRNAVKENKVGHAYLFCGPRGTGKTSMARLLARAVNCSHPESAPCNECDNCKAAIEGSHPDIIEINAANETHVEDIRDLIDRARLSPMMGKHKIYIIDEVHQLSSSAASALLKTLEEPPEHVIFILATTDPQKLLKTIISRCQRFDFSKVDAAKIQNHLLGIAEKEGFTLEPEAALKIAELADGGMRDSLSILEQARAYGAGEITESTIDSIFGLASSGEKIALLEDIFNGNLEGVLQRVESCETHGVDIRRLTEDLIT